MEKTNKQKQRAQRPSRESQNGLLLTSSGLIDDGELLGDVLGMKALLLKYSAAVNKWRIYEVFVSESIYCSH